MKKTMHALSVLVAVDVGPVAGTIALAKPTPPPPKPNCKFVLCAYPDCLPTERTEIPAGECCPVCVPN